MLDHLRTGDTLIVWKLDRLGRSMSLLIDTVRDLDQRDIGFRSLTEGQAVLFINSETRLKAKEIAKGWDIDHEWCDWVTAQNLGTPKNPDKAFLGFCRNSRKKRGRPS